MPDIMGTAKAKVQPNTANLPVFLPMTVCNSITANDGQIPYGDTLLSATVKAYSPSGEDVTDKMVTQAPRITDNVISCQVGFFDGMVAGRYKLTFTYICSSGYTDEIGASRLIVEDT